MWTALNDRLQQALLVASGILLQSDFKLPHCFQVVSSFIVMIMIYNGKKGHNGPEETT